jgi:membrane protease YdiL (CAAX protease family)
MSTQTTVSSPASLWNRVPLVVRAAILGLIVMAAGVQVWSGLILGALRLEKPLLPLLVMPVLLVLYWLFFSGSLLWSATKPARREAFRTTSLSRATWIWGLAGAGLFVVAFHASVFTLFRLVPYPAEQFVVPAVLAKIPANLLWPYVILSSIVAGVCEETGFRGYMQQPLERRYGPASAIVLATIGFVALHLNQAWIGALLFPAILASIMLGVLAYASRSLIPSMIGHAVMDVFNFGYWWWHLLGDYNRRPISETGVDLNFAAWAGTLVISLGLFVLVVRKLGSAAGREKQGRFAPGTSAPVSESFRA